MFRSGNKKEGRVIKTETRTVTRNGVTETVTTETIETRNGEEVSKTVRTVTTDSGDNDFQNLSSEIENVNIESGKTKSKSTTNEVDFAQECLQAHNDKRKKHGTPPLKLSETLNRFAKEWAEKLAKEDKFQHRNDNQYGENIYMKWSSDPSYDISGNDAVDSWYSEIKDHEFGKEPNSLRSGHFTQVIWKSSAELGVAKARSKTGKIIVVANYKPAGNMMGRFSENVPPPK